MKKVSKTVLVAVLIVTIVLFNACRNNPVEITVSQANELAHDYFKELYDLDITVIGVSYEQVGEHDYLNMIRVSDGETEYKLILDKNNKPASDNVSALNTIKNIDLYSYDEILAQLELRLHKYYDLEAVAAVSDLQYRVYLSVNTVDRPIIESIVGINSFLEILKKDGVDELIIYVHSPRFLLPKVEFGHGTISLNLTGIRLKTDMSFETLSGQYQAFVNQVYWNEQKFEEKVSELTGAGYKNAYFFISKWADGNTLEIILYCESDANLSAEAAINLLDGIDESYFRIGDNEIKYTVQHVVNN